MTYPPPLGMPHAPSPPPEDGQWRPARVDQVPGTDYGLVEIEVPPVTSGLATGSMLAGIASVLVSVLVLCFGSMGATPGWGAWVAGAFTLLATLCGAGAVGVGLTAVRQIQRSGRDGRLRFVGRAQAITGISCGAGGVGIALLFLGLAILWQVS